MITEKHGDRIYLKSDLLKDVPHGFTTKCGGFSNGKIEGLNLGFRCGDENENVKKNYRIAAEDLCMPYEAIVASRQTHSTNIRIVTGDDVGKGVSRDSDIQETDGLVTDCKNIPLVIFYADCVPILLADLKREVVAAVHSGWRGTKAGIVRNAVKVMREKFGSEPEDIKAVIGPSIGPCCFEVGREVAEQFESRFVAPKENGKFTVDLWAANQKLLLESGIHSANIEIFRMCTVCNQDMLYSYRSHGENTGRMGAFIMNNKDQR